jgi:hypothetical protein
MPLQDWTSALEPVNAGYSPLLVCEGGVMSGKAHEIQMFIEDMSGKNLF